MTRRPRSETIQQLHETPPYSTVEQSLRCASALSLYPTNLRSYLLQSLRRRGALRGDVRRQCRRLRRAEGRTCKQSSLWTDCIKVTFNHTTKCASKSQGAVLTPYISPPNVTAEKTHDGERRNFPRKPADRYKRRSEVSRISALSRCARHLSRQVPGLSNPKDVLRGNSRWTGNSRWGRTQHPDLTQNILEYPTADGGDENTKATTTTRESRKIWDVQKGRWSRHFKVPAHGGIPSGLWPRSKTYDSRHDIAPRLSVRGLMDRSFAFKSDTGRVS